MICRRSAGPQSQVSMDLQSVLISQWGAVHPQLCPLHSEEALGERCAAARPSPRSLDLLCLHREWHLPQTFSRTQVEQNRPIRLPLSTCPPCSLPAIPFCRFGAVSWPPRDPAEQCPPAHSLPG